MAEGTVATVVVVAVVVVMGEDEGGEEEAGTAVVEEVAGARKKDVMLALGRGFLALEARSPALRLSGVDIFLPFFFSFSFPFTFAVCSSLFARSKFLLFLFFRNSPDWELGSREKGIWEV